MATVPTGSEEVELKLALTPKALQRLPRCALVRSLKTRRPQRQTLVSTYFDTPTLMLKRHGMALRVRHDGSGYVQTLKAPLSQGARPGGRNGKRNGNGNRPESAGLQHLREFEAPLPEGVSEPDLSLVDDADLQAFFAREGVARDLEAVFTTEFARQTVPLMMADSEVELALDEGRILANGDVLALCEAELELKRGRPGRLYELAMLLHRQIPFRLERDSKAARGYRLYSAAVPAPQKAEKSLVSPEMTAAEAFVELARAGVRQMRANEQPVLDGRDPEGVHQMRVAIRRLRALVSVFKPLIDPEVRETLRGELKWMQNALGPARDWDVFLAETLAPLRHRLPGADSLELLEAEARRQRDSAYTDARAAVTDDRYTDLLLRLQLWLDEGGWRAAAPTSGESDPTEQPVTTFARALLSQRAKKFRKLGKRYDQLSELQLHDLRIRGKKLRYAGEFFASAFPRRDAKGYLNRLEAIQDRLGAVNDASVGQRLLDRLERPLAEAETGSPAIAAGALGIVQGWQAARIHDELAAFATTWKKFAKTKPFWT